jgi:hypothetical protein
MDCPGRRFHNGVAPIIGRRGPTIGEDIMNMRSGD